ncbi:hypothetical protein GQ53DRAFT_804551 [Thozetella sp. PMI_491]|nr:hypothetical protein GQ53DRAFT_804551 [Thozetella sp. PMI_491]
MAKKGNRGILTRYRDHHCPTCGKINKRVCIKKGHYTICEEHQEKYGSWYDCVKCQNTEARDLERSGCSRASKKVEAKNNKGKTAGGKNAKGKTRQKNKSKTPKGKKKKK